MQAWPIRSDRLLAHESPGTTAKADVHGHPTRRADHLAAEVAFLCFRKRVQSICR